MDSSIFAFKEQVGCYHKEAVMECRDVDKLKPLDKLLEDQIEEFDSGKDRVCDKDLDKMMWELGDYESEEPKMEADEFAEEKPIEENLVEKKLVGGSNKKPYYMKDSPVEEDIMPGDEVAAAHSMNPDTGKGKDGSIT
jgi:hypothetical protein